MSITPKDVEHIRRLARVYLSRAEEAKFEKELVAILEFFEKLNEVETEAIEPMTAGADLTAIGREDGGTEPGLTGPELAHAAEGYRDGWIRVPAVFKDR